MTKSSDIVTGLQLKENDLDDIVKRLCFFAPSGSGAYLRDLLEFLALQSLSMLPSAQLSGREIYQKLVQTIGSRFEYEEVLDALVRLVAKKSIHCDKDRPIDPDSKFYLDIAIRSQMRDQVSNETKLESDVLQEWQAYLRKKYPNLTSSDIDNISRDLKIFAFRLLSQHSAETLELYYGNDEALTKLLQQLETRNVAEIWEAQSAEYSAIRLQEVIGFFREASDKRKQYIASLMHSLFILQLTHLDPQCAAIVRSQISPAKIFLDTNFIFRLVGLQGPDFFLASKKLTEMSLNLGFQLVVSPQTLKEYEKTLAEFLKEIKGRPVISSDLASLALAATSDEDFITAYWSQVKEKGTYVDPTIFYEYYQYLVPILKDNNVDVDDAFSDEVLSRDQDLASEESLLKEVMQSFNARAADNVSQHVLKHDVFHRLLIMRHRQGLTQERFSDARAWFLTCDTKLSPYDRVARNKQGQKDNLPFCVTSGQWMQTLRPFSGRNGDFDLAQVEMIVSPLFRAYQRPPSQLINDVVSRLAATPIYSPSAVGAMLSDRQFLNQFENVKDDSQAQHDIIDNYFASYADEMEARANQLEEVASQAKIELETQTRIAAEQQQKRLLVESDLQKSMQKVAQLEVSQLTLSNSLNAVQSRAEDERLEREKSQQEKELLERDYEEKLKKLADENRAKNQGLRRRAIIGFMLLASVVALVFLKQAIQNSPASTLEIVGSLAIGLYIGLVVILDFWRTVTGIVVSLVAPIVFTVSLFLPLEATNAVQVTAIIVGGIVSLLLFIRQSSSHSSN